MGDKKADALVAGRGERSPRDLRGIQPCCYQDYGDGEGEVELHALLIVMKAGTLWIRHHCFDFDADRDEWLYLHSMRSMLKIISEA